MRKTLGTVLERSQDALSTQILFRAFKNQFLNVSVKKKKKKNTSVIRNMLKNLLNPFIKGREIKIIILTS